MCQKWEGDCGLWVLDEIAKKSYTESLKKIVSRMSSKLLRTQPHIVENKGIAMAPLFLRLTS